MISAERATRAPARAPTRPPSSRAGVVRSLTQLGVSNPNFVMHFTTPDQLGWHLADRYVATLRKRGGVLALMNAVESDPTRVRVGGAMLQDGRGSSSSVMIGGRNFFSGVERGHVAMGTYTLDGESVSQRVLRRLRAASVDSLRVPALVELLAFNLGLDGGTEGVPAMINRSSGIAIEKGVIRSLDVNKPLASRQGEGAMERSYIVELERLFEMLVFDPATVVAPIESRLMAITSGNAREILQNPADTKNLMFGGKERTYLEEVLAQLESQYGDFAKLTGEFERDIPSNARHFAELSAIARDEWAAVMDSIPEIEKPG